MINILLAFMALLCITLLNLLLALYLFHLFVNIGGFMNSFNIKFYILKQDQYNILLISKQLIK